MKVLGFEISRSGGTQKKRGLKRMRMDAGRASRLEDGWGSTPVGIDAMVVRWWSVIVGRSRESYENNPLVKKFSLLQKINVIGDKGIKFQSRIERSNGEPDEKARKAVETAWKKFSEMGNFSVCGKLSRVEFEQLAISTAAIDGEFLAITVESDEATPGGFGLQVVDPITLDAQHCENLQNGEFIRHGIHYNKYGRPLNYHFNESVELYFGRLQYPDRGKMIIPADRVIHFYLSERPGQKRGMPWTRASLWSLHMIKGLKEATLTAIRAAASMMGGFFSSEEGQNDDDVDEVMDAEPGVFRDIGNREYHSINSQYPQGEYAPYMQNELHSASAGLGVSYHGLTGDLSKVNFSSIRQGTLEDREHYKMIQGLFIESVTKRIFKVWLKHALLRGQIKAKSGRVYTAVELEKFLEASFMGPRWTWIDPLRDVKAMRESYDMGMTSISREITKAGGDPDEILEERKRDEKKGLIPFSEEQPLDGENTTEEEE